MTDYAALVIFSGGLDSTTLLHHVLELKEEPLAISFNYGQKHAIELDRAKDTAADLGISHKIVDMSSISNMLANTSSLLMDSDINVPNIKEVIGHPQPNTYVPFRNLMMLTIGASIAESYNISKIYTGVQAQDLYAYWDTSAKFISKVNDVLKLNRKFKVSIIAPYAHLTKADIIEQGIKYGVDYFKTNTCYNPNSKGISCGICPSCAERIQAFVKNKIKDPIEYQIEINWDELLCAQ